MYGFLPPRDTVESENNDQEDLSRIGSRPASTRDYANS